MTDLTSLCIFQVVAEGLTGNISFTDSGRRQGYSMDVVEMAHDSRVVKVRTWTNEIQQQSGKV